MAGCPTPVLLWGTPRDTPLAAVGTALSRLGTPMFLVDQTRVLETRCVPQAGREGSVFVGDQRCELDDVRSVYVRADASCLPDFIAPAAPGSPPWRHAVAVDAALAMWLVRTPARVVNPLSAMASNGSKPYQAMLIRQAGFDVPETLLTNDLETVRAFEAEHGPLVYKSASGVRSIVSRLSLQDAERLRRLSTCPTQFQRWVAGDDHRLHVIGDEVFGHRIECDADDYRYAAPGETTVHAWPVPVALAERACALAASLGLVMAGIDLRLDRDGRWVCFEVNPSPGFTFFDDDEQPMADAVARLLSRT